MLQEVFSSQINKVDFFKILNANSSISYQNNCTLDFQLGNPIEISNEFRYKESTSNQKHLQLMQKLLKNNKNYS